MSSLSATAAAFVPSFGAPQSEPPDEDEDNIESYLREEEERLNQQEIGAKETYTVVEQWEEDLFAMDNDDAENIESYLQEEETRFEKQELHGKHRYGDMEYWDDRYGGLFKDPFDWLFTYEDVAQIMEEFVDKRELLMVTGCGNAPFSRDAYFHGFIHQLNTDYSEKVIDDMLYVHQDLPQLNYQCMDALDLKLDDESVGAIIDKGVYDTIICYTNRVKAVLRMVYEAHRVLRPGGCYIFFSLHPPEDVLGFVEKQPGLNWVTHAIRLPNQRGEAHSVIICRKMREGIQIPAAYCNEATDLPTFRLRERIKRKARRRRNRLGADKLKGVEEEGGGAAVDSLAAALGRALDVEDQRRKARLVRV